MLTLLIVLIGGVGLYSWQGLRVSLRTQPPKPVAEIQTTADTPNIVYIMADDLDFALMNQLPKLKALMADTGVTFLQHFVSLSLCCPSRASILCGQYAHNTGVYTNEAENADGTSGAYTAFKEFNNEEKTVGVWLQQAGYRTALMGKYLNGYGDGSRVSYTPPIGWSEWVVPIEGNPYSQYNFTLNVNGEREPYYLAGCANGTCHKDAFKTRDVVDKQANYMTNVLLTKATDFITRASLDQVPFFLYLATYSPHSPSTPSPEHEHLLTDKTWLAAHPLPRRAAFNETDTRDKPSWMDSVGQLTTRDIKQLEEQYRKRLISMYSVEDLVEQVIATLTQTGQLENTYIIFTSDNGYHLGEHRLLGGKLTAFDTDLHVPLFVRGPSIASRSTVTALTANVDFAATFADLVGVTVPTTIDGRSFAPLLFGQSTVLRHALLLEHGDSKKTYTERTDTTDEPRDVDEPSGTSKGGELVGKYIGLRTSRYTYVLYDADKEQELYDNSVDPHQLTNIALSADVSLLGTLRDWATDLSTCQGETCRSIEAENRLE